MLNWQKNTLRIYELYLTGCEKRISCSTPIKVRFFKREYLGHEITPDRIEPLERNVEKIINFPESKSKKELDRFLGLASYYRKFINNFAKHTHNLNRLKIKNILYDFDEKCKHEFNELRKILSSYPLIKHPDNSKPFILHTIDVVPAEDSSEVAASELVIDNWSRGCY